jgi:DNA-binding TFAR19-related protein (PDSD5 family)
MPPIFLVLTLFPSHSQQPNTGKQKKKTKQNKTKQNETKGEQKNLPQILTPTALRIGGF